MTTEDVTPLTPDSAATWARDKETIYAQEPGYANPVVADLGTAQRMADFENIANNPDTKQEDRDMAMDASAKIEASAEIDASGLTPEQKSFLEAIEGIKERHPGVLEEEIDGGQKIWKLKGGNSHEIMYMTKDGVYNVSLEKTSDNINELSLAKVAEQLNLTPTGGTRFISGGVSKDPNAIYNMGFNFRGVKLNLEKFAEKDWFKRGIAMGDRLVAEEKEQGSKISSSDILSSI